MSPVFALSGSKMSGATYPRSITSSLPPSESLWTMGLIAAGPSPVLAVLQKCPPGGPKGFGSQFLIRLLASPSCAVAAALSTTAGRADLRVGPAVQHPRARDPHHREP